MRWLFPDHRSHSNAALAVPDTAILKFSDIMASKHVCSPEILSNSGTVTSGTGSIGIYSANGRVNNNNTSNIGNSGIGIYSTNGIVNLNAGSVINMGTDGAVAVSCI